MAAGDVPSISVRDEVTDILGANVDMTRTKKLPSKTLHSKSQENEGDDSFDVAGNSDDNNDEDNDDIDSEGESDLGEEADKAKDGEVHESSSESEVDSDNSHDKSSHYIPSFSDNKHVIEVQIQVNKNDGLFGAADNAHHNDGSFSGDNDSTKHANVTHNFIDSKEQEAWNKANQVDSFPTKNIPEKTRTSIEDECVILKDIRKETDLDQERKGRKKEKISFSSKAKTEQNIEAQVTTGSENATKTVTLFRNAKETLVSNILYVYISALFVLFFSFFFALFFCSFHRKLLHCYFDFLLHLMSSPEYDWLQNLQNRSFHVVERTRTSSKCQKMKKCTCKACKNTVFQCQICKFVGFLLPSSPWLLKLPTDKRTGGLLICSCDGESVT